VYSELIARGILGAGEGKANMRGGNTYHEVKEIHTGIQSLWSGCRCFFGRWEYTNVMSCHAVEIS
jgi:hypothetical protein